MDGSFLLLRFLLLSFFFFVSELIVLQIEVQVQGIWCLKFALHPLRRECKLWP